MEDDSIDMGDDLKMTVSTWKMTVSIWKMTVSTWNMTVSIWNILSLWHGPAMAKTSAGAGEELARGVTAVLDIGGGGMGDRGRSKKFGSGSLTAQQGR